LNRCLLLLLCLCGCSIHMGRLNDTVAHRPPPAQAIMAQRAVATGPRITSIVATDPSATTPPYCFWSTNWNQYTGWTWMLSGCQTTQFCQEVTLTFTAVPGKMYAIEQTHFPVAVAAHRGSGKWRRVSPSSMQLWWQSGSGAITVRFGSPYAENYFRIIEQ